MSLIAYRFIARQLLTMPKYKDTGSSRIPGGLTQREAIALSRCLTGFAKSVSEIQVAYIRLRLDIVRFMDEVREVGDRHGQEDSRVEETNI